MGEPDDRETRAALQAILADPDQKKRLFKAAASFGKGTTDPSALMSEACVKLLSGRTPWRRSTHPELLDHLGSVMFTIVDHMRTSAHARRVVLFDEADGDEQVPDGGGGAPGAEYDAEDERRMVHRLGRWMRKLREDRADDRDALAMLDAFEAGAVTAAEQVPHLRWSIERVRRVRRRLFDRADLVAKGDPDGGGPRSAGGGTP
ncbi:MAG TPA: hypothetical protein VGG39_32115 [Polyangiaceae bacterium]